MAKEKEMVKHPSHYEEGRKYAPYRVIRDWGLNFNLGNAVKYLSRAGNKDDIVQDLKKAQTYIQFEIDAIEEERKKKTNYERIKEMTEDDIARIIGCPADIDCNVKKPDDCDGKNCYECLKRWLESEVADD